MNARRLALATLLALAACGKNGEEGCEEVAVLVHVTDPANAGIEGADVSLSNTDCEDLGGGDYQCMVAPGTYNLYAVQVGFEPFGQEVDVEEPESCDETALERDVQLQVESAV
ncbi:MAG: carboxypeptidase regulatory-like domain-containing protein [Alphaproteobacteria bacterium]|nr:carboxypeptidase regulatory-like domain-containing protein [Alphaproteobacteria bacterium]MCB9696432.1 carboxypeptidase regulatory-like domain-containing protein [Alphaproteobacteria bacterium]